MTTTIEPSLGEAPLVTQQGPGTTPGYAAIDIRRLATGGGELQEGVVGATDYEVVQRGAGANMSVDITMPTGGMAYVQGDSVAGQGLYPVPVHNATVNETITANASGNPRVDSIILEVLDNVHDATGSNLARTRVLTGTASGGATLDNRTGAAALPSNALLLADVLVASGAASLANSVIRDRRKWARGAYVRIVRNQNAGGGSDYTTSTNGAIDSTNLAPRLEVAGNPVRISLRGRMAHSSAGQQCAIDFQDNGAFVDGSSLTSVALKYDGHAPTNGDVPLAFAWDWTPAAGSHVIVPWFATSGATMTILARATFPVELIVEELVKQNRRNNQTTSG